jgi:hypothetical protein
MSDLVPIRRALISVSDKTGLIDLARKLSERGVKLISTGGTAKAIADAGLPVEDVSSVTGFPEIMDGRVKTLHPKVHGGLLAIRGNPEHEAARAANGIETIDLLVVNLYPFEETVARNASFDDTIENIDIGGPAMIRAAAKNHQDVAVVVDTADYDSLRWRLVAVSPPRPMPAPRPMTRRSADGSPTSCLMPTRPGGPSAASSSSPFAMARTRIRRRPSTRRPRSARALPPPVRSRAKSSPTTTSTTPTPPLNAWPSSVRPNTLRS